MRATFSRRAQTATEYLIILAVVIIIALIVVVTMGGIPGIGGGASDNVQEQRMSSQPIGISSWTHDSLKTSFTLRNNRIDGVEIDSVYIDGEKCTFPQASYVLSLGESQRMDCYGVRNSNIDTRYELPMIVIYKDVSTGVVYNQSDVENKIVGVGLSAYTFDSGQTDCFDESGSEISCDGTYQDGDKRGKRKEFRRVDDVVIDMTTGLIWQYSDYPNINFSDALLTCNSSMVGGYSDWRLPNFLELQSLSDNDPSAIVTESRSSAVEWSSTDPYWSSTMWNPAPLTVYNDGGAEWSTVDQIDRHARCVRGQNPILKTGADICYDASYNPTDCSTLPAWLQLQDAARDGTAKSLNVHADIVQDSITGLEWQRTPNTTLMTHTQALDYCAGLSIGGKNDWRLPNMYEAFTLFDYGENDVQNSALDWGATDFWFSTMIPGVERYTWRWRLDDTPSEWMSPGQDRQSDTNAARCVRGGWV